MAIKPLNVDGVIRGLEGDTGRGPPIELPPQVLACHTRMGRAGVELAFQDNHWWQNWGKNQAYVCRRMYFPRNVEQIAVAIRDAEADSVPLRAVGGGWSFSSVTLPGEISPPRPFAAGLDALSLLAAAAQNFPENPRGEVIATVLQPPGPPSDGPGSLVLRESDGVTAIAGVTYTGAGRWTVDPGGILSLLRSGRRPINVTGDKPGSLAIFNLASRAFVVDRVYVGSGTWITNVLGDRPRRMASREFFEALEPGNELRPCNPAFALSLIRRPANGYVVNTDSLTSSLQVEFDKILVPTARAAMAAETDGRINPRRRHFVHVEAGITMTNLARMLEMQSPPLAIEASGGSPGASIAGVLATATHGGELNSPLLVDRIKAVHLVGPGGVQWWIEGDEPIADPEKLMKAYPCLTRDRIISGRTAIGGALPRDWLGAVTVSLGCVGILYSVVLEAVPLFGIHEVVQQTRWSALLSGVTYNFPDRGISNLRSEDFRRPPAASADRVALGRLLNGFIQSGSLTGIRGAENKYLDIAIDPNPVRGLAATNRDWNCWIINRKFIPQVPIDPKPTPSDMIGRIADSLNTSFADRAVRNRFLDIEGASLIRALLDNPIDVPGELTGGGVDRLINLFKKVIGSSDMINGVLDTLTAPFETSPSASQLQDFKVASALVSGLFGGLLGVKDGRAETTASAKDTGAIGFPEGGIMGTAIEVAMPPEEAFYFLQTEVLDRVTQPIFGYVSIRWCPQTATLLGMQQFSTNIMIEVVAFATASARRYVAGIQAAAAARMRAVPALNRGRPGRLQRFIDIRRQIAAAAGGGRVNVFDNAMSRRLGL